MKYNYDDKTNKLLTDLEQEILAEYDDTPEISVRVNLLPMSHNTLSKYEKVFNEDGTRKTVTNEHNSEHAKTVVAIHESTPGMADGSMPTKPDKYIRGIPHYEKLLRYGSKNRPHGSTIGYHSMVAYPGLLNRPEIVIYLPATSSPDQVGNRDYAKYTYGIERLCGKEQNYHLGIANQAMLTAFVLREMGYDKESAMRHVFPHNFFAKNHKDCPARMLYASRLLEKTKEGIELTSEEQDIVKEYVPWQVFSNLVGSFFERDKYPQQLEEKFIMDMDDYQAYMSSPESYNYSERKKSKTKAKVDSVELTGAKEKQYNTKFTQINIDEDLER